MIHSDLCCKATCNVCYPPQLRSAGCTLCDRVCSWACSSKPRDPYAQFEEGKVAIETIDRFLTP